MYWTAKLFIDRSEPENPCGISHKLKTLSLLVIIQHFLGTTKEAYQIREIPLVILEMSCIYIFQKGICFTYPRRFLKILKMIRFDSINNLWNITKTFSTEVHSRASRGSLPAGTPLVLAWEPAEWTAAAVSHCSSWCRIAQSCKKRNKWGLNKQNVNNSV